jgi:predicted double-glycine peptidase
VTAALNEELLKGNTCFGCGAADLARLINNGEVRARP